MHAAWFHVYDAQNKPRDSLILKVRTVVKKEGAEMTGEHIGTGVGLLEVAKSCSWSDL